MVLEDRHLDIEIDIEEIDLVGPVGLEVARATGLRGQVSGCQGRFRGQVSGYQREVPGPFGPHPGPSGLFLSHEKL